MSAPETKPPATPAPDVPKNCSTCQFWAPQVGINKGICRVPATDGAMEVLANDPSAMLLTAPTFYCSEWVLD